MKANIGMAGIYARVSTSEQNVDMQLGELRDYCKKRGWQIFREYVDVGISGSKDSVRPELNRLMSDAKQRRFDGIVVWKLDRFGRSLRHLVNALADLESLGVSFISLKDNLDLSTPSGRLMCQIICAMAEFERELIRERVKAGLRNAKTKGVILGRPRKLDNPEAIARLRSEGASWRAVGKALGVSAATAYCVGRSVSVR